ncbi:hypothetical protein PTSG_05834 [Salpingoeca rosetta]|uniref:Uncharacterized protein n=1 Tax=Salpingoeca rosetta (strain ATCC 50818 / BSB-021) TaxID=946362 RepID=F2UCX5_SALR5|nr:uncharacterized protein PTSG_05834 [Salpingoeca rosetta]EGD74470.1 hypothetical protein PTSG_05834 [Salpingoeca rosetta]|eukprot:XP_004992727.1 hypothetical protein PTSG_05834 [Salpingoeca rosetta]
MADDGTSMRSWGSSGGTSGSGDSRGAANDSPRSTERVREAQSNSQPRVRAAAGGGGGGEGLFWFLRDVDGLELEQRLQHRVRSVSGYEDADLPLDEHSELTLQRTAADGGKAGGGDGEVGKRTDQNSGAERNGEATGEQAEATVAPTSPTRTPRGAVMHSTPTRKAQKEKRRQEEQEQHKQKHKRGTIEQEARQGSSPTRRALDQRRSRTTSNQSGAETKSGKTGEPGSRLIQLLINHIILGQWQSVHVLLDKLVSSRPNTARSLLMAIMRDPDAIFSNTSTSLRSAEHLAWLCMKECQHHFPGSISEELQRHMEASLVLRFAVDHFSHRRQLQDGTIDIAQELLDYHYRVITAKEGPTTVSDRAVDLVDALLRSEPVLGAAVIHTLASTDMHDIARLHGDSTLRSRLLRCQVR